MARIEYTPRHLGRTYLERDRDNALRLGVYFGSGVVTPTSGTFSLYNSANVLVVDAAAVVMDASGFATVTVSAATLTSSALGSGWRVEWDLLMPDTYHHVYRNAASLCRVRLPPAATEADLLRLHPDLRSYLPKNQTSWQDQLDVAWEFHVAGKLETMGRRPYLVVDENALVPVHTFETLAVIGGALNPAGDPESRWGRFESRYTRKASEAWSSCSFEYDETDSGKATANKHTAASSTIWLSSVGEEDGRSWS